MKHIKNKAYPLLVFIFVCTLSCQDKEKEVIMELTSVYVNYFENDSIQKKVDYYPLRFYMHLQLVNETRNTIYVPIQNESDTLIQSTIHISGLFGVNYSGVRYVSVKDYLIKPKDTMYISLRISFCKDWAVSSNEDSIKKVVENLDIFYIRNKNETETVHWGVSVPNIIVKKSERLQVEFREEDSKDEMIMWI